MAWDMETDTGLLPQKGNSLSFLPNLQQTGSEKGPCFMIASCEQHLRQSSSKNLVHHLDPAESWPEIDIVLPNGPWCLPMEIHPSLHWRELNQYHFLTNTGWLAGACWRGSCQQNVQFVMHLVWSFPNRAKKYCPWIVPEASVIFKHYLLPSKCSWWQLELVKFSLTSPD